MDTAWAPIALMIIIAAAIVAIAAVAGGRRTRAASASDRALAEIWSDPALIQTSSRQPIHP
jgi:hypothetical protein